MASRSFDDWTGAFRSLVCTCEDDGPDNVSLAYPPTGDYADCPLCGDMTWPSAKPPMPEPLALSIWLRGKFSWWLWDNGRF